MGLRTEGILAEFTLKVKEEVKGASLSQHVNYSLKYD